MKYLRELSPSSKVFLLFVFLYIIFMSGHMGGDAMWAYLTAESIVRDGNLILNDHPDREFQIPELRPAYDEVTGSGVWPRKEVISKFGIGYSLSQIPFFLAGLLITVIFPSLSGDYILMFFTSLANCVYSALLVTLLYRFVVYLGVAHKRSLIFSVALGLCTFVFSYARQGFSEPFYVLLVMLAVYYGFRFRKEEKVKYLVYTGIFMGLSLHVRLESVLYTVPVFFLFTFSKDLRKFFRNMVIAGLPIFIFLLGFFLFNYIRYGSLFNTGHSSGQYLNFHPFSMYANIYDMFLSSGQSLFLYAPVMLLMFPGFKFLYRKDNFGSLVIIAILLANVGLLSLLPKSINGGLTWGPRYQYIFLPFGCLFAAVYFEYGSPKLWLRRALPVLMLIGLIVQLPSVLVNSSQMCTAVEREFENLKVINSRVIMDNVPDYSPVICGFYHLGSAISSSLTGKHLIIPVYIGYRSELVAKIDFIGIDYFDIWIFHLFKNSFISTFIKIFGILILFALIAGVVSLTINLCKLNAIK